MFNKVDKITTRYELRGLNKDGSLSGNTYSSEGYKNLYNGNNIVYGVAQITEHMEQLIKESKNSKYPIKRESLCIVQIDTKYTKIK